MPQKTVAGTAAGAATIIIVWAIGLTGVPVPPEVASAFTTLMAAAAVYFTPHEGAQP